MISDILFSEVLRQSLLKKGHTRGEKKLRPKSILRKYISCSYLYNNFYIIVQATEQVHRTSTGWRERVRHRHNHLLEKELVKFHLETKEKGFIRSMTFCWDCLDCERSLFFSEKSNIFPGSVSLTFYRVC